MELSPGTASSGKGADGGTLGAVLMRIVDILLSFPGILLNLAIVARVKKPSVGFVIFAGVAWLLSNNRRRIAWKTIGWGVALQLIIGLIIFRLPVSQRILLWLNDAVLVLLNASKSGSVFLFGPLAASPGESGSVGFILVFQVLPVVIFFAAFTAMLYHLRVLQVFVRLFARLFHRTMKISGAESLSSAANIFVGIESALVVRPYLERMTRSELLPSR